jgi:hypothetical protein
MNYKILIFGRNLRIVFGCYIASNFVNYKFEYKYKYSSIIVIVFTFEHVTCPCTRDMSHVHKINILSKEFFNEEIDKVWGNKKMKNLLQIIPSWGWLTNQRLIRIKGYDY